MGKEKSAEWYDQTYINSNYNLPIEDCGYRKLYESVLELMPLNKGVKILELGCGTGRLAKLLYDNGYKNYKGVDFSRVAIENARKYAKDCKFSVSNIMADHILELFRDVDLFIILETLEHIRGDRFLLKKIPRGKRVIFSVPPNDYESHVRFFTSFKNIEDRYGGLLDFEYCNRQKIGNNIKPHKSKLFLCDPIRRV